MIGGSCFTLVVYAPLNFSASDIPAMYHLLRSLTIHVHFRLHYPLSHAPEDRSSHTSVGKDDLTDRISGNSPYCLQELLIALMQKARHPSLFSQLQLLIEDPLLLKSTKELVCYRRYYAALNCTRCDSIN